MYRISKVLNHNTVIAVSVEDNQEYLIMGKGIGFGRKVAERIEAQSDASVYSLKETTKRGSARELAASISPEYLEIANIVLKEAEKEFESIDQNILFPMADHIEYAVKRIRNHESISNPLTDDIRLLFHGEYKVACCIVPVLKSRMGIDIDEDEVGYIALHVHTAIVKEELSQAMQMAQAVRDCVSYVEQILGKKLNIMSLSYNRLMNHIRYMVARGLKGEEIKLNMNDYMEFKFPKEFDMARTVCDELGKNLRCTFTEAEIGYLAMHLQRVLSDEEGQ
ncbi:MAG: PRD domain-containing protein [Dorea sp.]|jgi:transcriptional antiterminator|nr:PRD domain-containing protein [Dorea sp.]MCI9269837.1 PRD domain-containing protein [Dorea sp.]